MSNTTTASQPHRRASRSNSISSSVVTVKKSASVSSHGGSRSSYLRNRSTSPDSITRVLHSLNSSRSDFRNRPEAFESRKASGGINMNRWSHSTSSSVSAIDTDRINKRTSSIRRSVGPGFSSNGNTTASHSYTGSDASRGSPKRSSVKPSPGNRTSPLPGSRLAFNDASNLKIMQDLSLSSTSNSSTELFGPAWEQTSGVNKFGEPVQSLAFQYTSARQSSGHVDGSSSSVSLKSNRADQALRSAPSHRRDRSGTPSRDTTRSNSRSPSRNRNEPFREPNVKSPKRKDMLSKALSKANQAVLLDNAQNVNAAIEAYNEACELLQQVMMRSADLEDRKKLSSIRATYSNRIAELHDLDDSFVDLINKELPEDPPSETYDQPEDFYHEDAAYQSSTTQNPPILQLPLRQESLLPEIFGGERYLHDQSLPPVANPMRNSTLNSPMDRQYMPPPLSPKPPPPGQVDNEDLTPRLADSSLLPGQPHTATRAASWLEPYDEQSSKSSSRLSSIDIERKDNQLLSAIEAEFDAMNAAVEAAYDDDLDEEPTPRHAPQRMDFQNRDLDSSRASESNQSTSQPNRYDHFSKEYLDDQAEQEERLLEGLNRDFHFSGTDFQNQTASTLPRQSNSSTFSSRTWGSSVASTTATTRTTLSTLAEIIEPPPHEPPKGALPEPPQSPPKHADSDKNKTTSAPTSEKHVGIRERRMSGQSGKQLKVETFAHRDSLAQQAKSETTANVTSAVEDPAPMQQETLPRTLAPAASFSSSLSSVQPLTPLLSNNSGDLTHFETPATPALNQDRAVDDANTHPPSPSRLGKMLPPPPGPIRKNNSSSSLGKGNLSIDTGAVEADLPMTPGSAVFPANSRGAQSAITPAVPNASSNVLTTIGLGGMYLFDDLINDTQDPQSPSNSISEVAPLEPCPESFLLRPFWLMRCLYQALSHPRGGYVSSKLFIPRDIWRVRNVKIKAIDDKIAQCDLLAAALQKVAKVDTYDASAVLEELQAFEGIIDQVRITLSKKLGNDVGVSGSVSVFKSSPAGEDSADPLAPKSANTSSAAKSIASSWRKLRSKSSSAALSVNTKSDVGSQSVTIATLPMTSSSSVATSRSYLNARNRNPPPTPTALPQLLAPHAYYMCSLARLFDAVQILDSIARQAEDPGLKYSSQTHVGLELSVRNAAEFFAFYIIRFVMGDLLMLLDKFLKKGGEWVMA